MAFNWNPETPKPPRYAQPDLQPGQMPAGWVDPKPASPGMDYGPAYQQNVLAPYLQYLQQKSDALQQSMQSQNPFMDYVMPVLAVGAGGMFAGAGGAAEGAGAVAPWGAGEAVSGAYPGLEAGLSAGAGSTSGMMNTGVGATVPQGGQVFDFLDNVDWGGAGEAGQFSNPGYDAVGGSGSPTFDYGGAGEAGQFSGTPYDSYDLGGGLSVDQYGNIKGGLFEGGPGTPGAGDFGGTSGIGDWLKDPNNIQKILRAAGIGGNPSVPGRPGTSGGTGQYQFPWEQAIGSALGLFANKNAGDTQQALLDKAINSDLFRTEQPKYFQPAYDAATKGIGNTPYGQSIADATSRKMASMGYNMSGNQMSQVGQDLNRGTVDYMNAIRPFAMGHGGVGQTVASMTPGIVGSQNGMYNSIGAGIGAILNGQQPDSNQQRTGTPTNQNLAEWLKGL